MPTTLKNLNAQVMKMESIVDYQNGAIVSHTVIDKPSGTVTVFAFDKDQALSEHTTPFDAIVQIIDGEADISIDGETFRLRQNEMIIMPADLPHSIKAVTGFKMLLTMIR